MVGGESGEREEDVVSIVGVGEEVQEGWILDEVDLYECLKMLMRERRDRICFWYVCWWCEDERFVIGLEEMR